MTIFKSGKPAETLAHQAKYFVAFPIFYVRSSNSININFTLSSQNQ